MLLIFLGRLCRVVLRVDPLTEPRTTSNSRRRRDNRVETESAPDCSESEHQTAPGGITRAGRTAPAHPEHCPPRALVAVVSRFPARYWSASMRSGSGCSVAERPSGAAMDCGFAAISAIVAVRSFAGVDTMGNSQRGIRNCESVTSYSAREARSLTITRKFSWKYFWSFCP